MAKNPYESPQDGSAQSASSRRRVIDRLWLWFAIGFVLVFIVQALCVTMYSMLPAGNDVIQCRLWQYYIIEIRREFGFSANVVGPASGSSSTFLLTAAFHILISAIGGTVLMGIGWSIRKMKRPAP